MRRQRLSYPPQSFGAIYAIGDVHGCLELLQEIESRIVQDARPIEGTRLIVMLGDYVDRGPQSAGVLDHLVSPPPSGFERICLAGNHDQMMLDAIDDPGAIPIWLANGGLETLRSYGVDDAELSQAMRGATGLRYLALRHVPSAHVGFLRALPIALVIGEVAFVHAAIEPGPAIADRSDEELLWARWEGVPERPGGPVIVHGHSIVRSADFDGSRVALDTGAFATGELSAVRISAEGLGLLSTAQNSVVDLDPEGIARDRLATALSNSDVRP